MKTETEIQEPLTDGNQTLESALTELQKLQKTLNDLFDGKIIGKAPVSELTTESIMSAIRTIKNIEQMENWSMHWTPEEAEGLGE